MPETALPRPPVTALIAAGMFVTGITYASTLNYAAIVGIDTLGIPNASYALLLMAASLVSAAASVTLGYVSDKVPDRRLLVIACALMGAFGFGLIFIFRNQIAFVIAIGVIMPFGGALFSQSFSFARSYNNLRNPARAEFMTSIFKTIYTVAWAIVPPFVGWVAATTSVFNIYGIAVLAYLVCAAIYLVLLRNPDAKTGVPKRAAGEGAPLQPKARIEPAILMGIAGCVLISMANYINNVTAPLLLTTTLKGSFGQLGLYAGLAAAMELPFIVAWGYALRWLQKHTIIIAAALLYALYLALLGRAQSIEEVLWLQLLNGPATGALLSIQISYLQDAIRGRLGLSTSLLDVVAVTSALSSAAIFGGLTAMGQNYPLLFTVAAGLAAAGAVVLFIAHRVPWTRPPPAAPKAR